jgi:V/A-type H+-transporting ATPase subunit K
MKWRIGWVVPVMVGLAALGSLALAAEPAAGTGPQEAGSAYTIVGLGLAAAFVGALSILAAAYAVARVGSAALGAMAEKPELFVRALIFVALAEGLAMIGFIISFLIYMKIP